MNEPRAARPLIERIDEGLAAVEAGLITAALAIMLTLASVNLALHKLFDAGFDWADIVVRQMVLWLGFLGGALATAKNRHIAIDAASKFLAPRRAAATKVITSIAAFFVSLFMLQASVAFVLAEIEDGMELFGGMPAWPFKVVIPVALFAISFHLLVSVYRYAHVALGNRPPLPAEEDIDDLATETEERA